ncbi:zinc ribbon domain-containing protein [Rhodoferax sp. BLA1]|uniref:zinc ribbon domain-containing protein n=1 Tax=Rhodoferax sp. BLA1 TaxID=2576062 RepID=UPI0015D1D70D|nr:zinc ribbon domain-containing protein [Rhodoferax sp. BLA1]
MNESTQQIAKPAQLIPCQTCQHLIGPQAETCPQCGSPNSWMHPVVAKAMSSADKLTVERRFQYWGKGAEVWGESVYHSPVAYLVMVGILVAILFSSLFTSIFGPALGGVGMVIYWRSTAKKETFRANLVTGSWESSNEKFWLPVHTFLFQPSN